MESLFFELIRLHVLCSCLLLLPASCNLFSILFQKSHTKRLKVFALVAPAYYTLLAISFFSGLVIWAMLQFVLDWRILLMVLLWLSILVFEIKRHKRQKAIKIEPNEQIRQSFFQWAKMKYLVDLLCVAFLILFMRMHAI